MSLLKNSNIYEVVTGLADNFPVIRLSNLLRSADILETGSTPEGSLTATPGSLALDTNNGVIYIKNTGIGNTGWLALSTSAASGWLLGGNALVGGEYLGSNNAFDTLILANNGLGGAVGAGAILIGNAPSIATVAAITIGGDTATSQEEISIGNDNFGTSSTLIRIGNGSIGAANTVVIGTGYGGSGPNSVLIGDNQGGTGIGNITIGTNYTSSGAQIINIGESYQGTTTQQIQIGTNTVTAGTQTIDLGSTFSGGGFQNFVFGNTFGGNSQSFQFGEFFAGTTSQTFTMGVGFGGAAMSIGLGTGATGMGTVDIDIGSQHASSGTNVINLGVLNSASTSQTIDLGGTFTSAIGTQAIDIGVSFAGANQDITIGTLDPISNVNVQSGSIALNSSGNTLAVNSNTGAGTALQNWANFAGDFNVFYFNATPEGTIIAGGNGDICIVDDATTGSVYVKQNGGATNIGWAKMSTSSGGGGPTYSRRTVADADTTLLSTDGIVAYTSITATRTVSLPAAAAVTVGQQYIVNDESGSVTGAINIVLDPFGAELIDGQATASITVPFGTIVFYSTGTAWQSV